jgi:hypothetical protein
MLNRKLPKRLFKNRDVIHAYENDRSARSRLKRMPRDHFDVLQNIEVGLVRTAQALPGIDDLAIHQALRGCTRGTELPEDADMRVVRLRAQLEMVREAREDVPDTVWNACLRTVDDSVERHSNLRPGETSYLSFIENYVR